MSSTTRAKQAILALPPANQPRIANIAKPFSRREKPEHQPLRVIFLK
jgi:hypothetical protein